MNRLWLLGEDDGAERVVRHLRREAAKSDLEPAVATATNAALSYCERRRPLMSYKAAREQGMPIGSGVITARGLQLSGRFDAAFWHHQATLVSAVMPA